MHTKEWAAAEAQQAEGSKSTLMLNVSLGSLGFHSARLSERAVVEPEERRPEGGS